MKDFILELYSEEIPARMQKPAEEQFQRLFEEFLEEYVVTSSFRAAPLVGSVESSKQLMAQPFNIEQKTNENNSSSYKHKLDSTNATNGRSLNDDDTHRVNISPCRITFTCKLPDSLPAKEVELKGPKVDAPAQAIEGFCRGNNISKDSLLIKDEKYYYAILKQPAQDIKDIIIKHLPEYLNKITWPKSMIWGSYNFPWVRPIKNILCLLGDEVVPLKFAHLEANNITFGHKFMSSGSIEIKNSADYFEKLEKAKVIVSREEREALIQKSLHDLCAKLGVVLNEDQKLLEEVTGLAEFPVLIHGKIAEKFMSLPPEVLITSMRHHQKYFTANNKDGSLAPNFLFVTNLDLDDYSEVISGNERVLSARLADALYFYNQDLQGKLENNLERLKNVVFHAKLGTLYDKSVRIEKLAGYLSKDKDAVTASRLAKCDLVSEMVGEFPELQGIMGSYYALAQGHSASVASAIRNHYKPMQADDEVPTGIAAIVALADKTDSLVGLYLAGERATGSKDPYALRRYALGIIRIILENKLDVDIAELVNNAESSFKKPVLVGGVESSKQFMAQPFNTENKSNENNSSSYEHKLDSTSATNGRSLNDGKLHDTLSEILSFIEERFKYLLKNSFNIEVINAVVDLRPSTVIARKQSDRGNPSSLLDLYKKVEAFDKIYRDVSGKHLISLYKRIKNLGVIVTGITHSNLSDDESKFVEITSTNKHLIEKAISSKDYSKAIELLLQFKTPLEEFLENNLVNTDDADTTQRRKEILCGVIFLFKSVANFDEFQ